MSGYVGRSAGVLCLIAVGVVGACGTGEEAGAPDVEIEPADVASAAATSTTLTHRFTGTMTLDDAEDVPVLSGMWDGERGYYRMDLEPMIEAMGSSRPLDLDELDVSMEVVSDATTTYVHAPDIGDLVQAGGRGTPPPLIAAVADLGAAWGRIDVAALGPDVPADLLNQLTAGQNMDPRVFLEMLSRTEDVDPLGGEEVDGVPTNGVAAEVGFVDMVEAQGLDATEITAEMIEGAGMSADEGQRLLDAFRVPIAVWIDDDDHVRRITVDLGEAIRAVAKELDEPLDVDDGFGFSMTIEFTDYDDTSIRVAIPDPAETVDITEDIRTTLDD